MSIVRIGLGETKNFAEGYDAIFGKKDKKDKKEEKATAEKPKEEPAVTEVKKPKKKK